MSDAFEQIDEGLPAADRRTHSRQPVRTLAYVELDEGNGGIVLNASEGGLSVQAVMGLMEESLPKMRFQLSQSKDWLETGARVVWANESRKVAGLQFVDLPEQTRLHIREWLTGESAGVESAEPHESAVGDRTLDQTLDPEHDQSHAHDRPVSATAKELAGAGATPPPPAESVSAPSPIVPPEPAMQLFGSAPAFRASAQPPKSVPQDAKRSDRAWNIAGIVALLAIMSLVVGWMAGRGMFDGLLDNIEGTASPTKTPGATLAPVSSGAGTPISDMETVDIHNQHWTIPFTPTASTNQAISHNQAAPPQWPAFNPATTTPEIQAPAAGGNVSQQPNPPEVATSSDSASVLIPSVSLDPRDLAPPTPKPEQQTAPPVSILRRGALIYHVDPVYPELAKEQEVQGTVKLQVTIGVTGAVRSVVAVSGPGLLVEAARSAVREWRYTPSLLNGKPVESQQYISIVFQLQSTSK
jgi:TonB family protein